MFFYDSYAIIEMLEGTQTYLPYANNPIITTALNLGETCLYYLKKNKEAEFLLLVKGLEISCLEISPEDAYNAMRFRNKNAGKRLSFIDCIGYCLANSNGLMFLTGDKEFEYMENVEFVK